jgi:hypothetical protein
MIFRITAMPQANGWSVTVDPPLPGLPRSLGQVIDPDCPGLTFPLPPADAAAPPTAELAQRLALLARREPGDDGAEWFGRYLFATLVGDALWTQIVTTAAGAPIELELCWDAADYALQRLPWELLHGPELFLIQEPGLTITRVVRATAAPVPAIELPQPPQALVVIGADLNSDLARGAADYLGMLWGDAALLHGIGRQILFHPSVAALQAAINSCRPTVIHLICPASFLAGAPTISLAGVSGAFLQAADLLAALRDDTGALPPLVVLSAGPAPAGTAAPQPDVPMAAALIAGGVALVVGLAGAITSQSCRLMARCFYEALSEPGLLNLPAILARARRAGLPHAAAERNAGPIVHHGKAPWLQIDWALPFVMQAETAVQFSVAAPPAGAPQPHAQKYIERKLNLLNYPVLCGRAEQLAEYHLLLADTAYQRAAVGGEVQALVITDEPSDVVGARFGLSRLLQEFAAEALRAGHIPLLISPHLPELQGQTWSMTPVDFAACLQRVAGATGRDLPSPIMLPLTRDLVAMAQSNQIMLPQALRDNPELNAIYDNNPADRNVLRTAFRLDIRNLLTQYAIGPDPLQSYERGLHELLQRLGASHAQRPAVDVYSQRLSENIGLTRKYGDTETRRAERAQILDELNQLALAELGVPYTELSARVPGASSRRVLLLVDDVHRLGEAADFLLDELLGDAMLDELRDQLRIVLTYSSRQAQGNQAIVHRVLKWLQDVPRARALHVGLFPQPFEERMVYNQLLLHWRDKDTGRRIILTPSDDPARSTMVGQLYRQLEREVRRVPSLLESERVAGIVDFLTEPQSAAEAAAEDANAFWALRLNDDDEALATTV